VSAETSMESACTRSGAGEMVDSGMIPVFPDTRELKVDSNAEMADEAIPSASILSWGYHTSRVIEIDCILNVSILIRWEKIHSFAFA